MKINLCFKIFLSVLGFFTLADSVRVHAQTQQTKLQANSQANSQAKSQAKSQKSYVQDQTRSPASKSKSLAKSLVKNQETDLDQIRLKGFSEFRSDSKIYDEEREKGYTAYLEGFEKELLDNKKALQEYRKEKSRRELPEETEGYLEYLKEKKEDDKDYETSFRDFVEFKKRQQFAMRYREVSEDEELDIYSHRPRYEYKKRAFYGGKPKFKVDTQFRDSGFGGSKNSGNNNNNFFNDPGFIPPPPPPPLEPFDDFPPPPPPPPPPPSDFLGDFDDSPGFIPPPPNFDGEF